MGRSASQRAVAQGLGISEQDFSNRKARGTLAEPIIDWCLENDCSLDYIFGVGSSQFTSPGWLSQHLETLNSLDEVDQGRVLGALQLLGLIKIPDKPEVSIEDKQAAVGGMARSRDGTR